MKPFSTPFSLRVSNKKIETSIDHHIKKTKGIALHETLLGCIQPRLLRDRGEYLFIHTRSYHAVFDLNILEI